MGCRRRRSRRHPIPAPRTTGKERDQESCNDYLGPGTAGRQSGGCFYLIRFRGWAGSTGTRMIARGLPPTCQIRKASTCTLTSSTTHSVGPIQQARMVVGPAPLNPSVSEHDLDEREARWLSSGRSWLRFWRCGRFFSASCAGHRSPGRSSTRSAVVATTSVCSAFWRSKPSLVIRRRDRGERVGRMVQEATKELCYFSCRFLWIEGLSDNRRACSSMVKQGTHNRAEGYFAPFFVHPH